MNTLPRLLLIFAWLVTAAALHAAEPSPAVRKPGEYHLGPDSLPQAGVPAGRLEGPLEFRSRIFAGTVRRYWIFVPAQYSAEKPAALLVFQDGQRAINPKGALRLPQVLENLIHKKDIPVTLGVFITPGKRSENKRSQQCAAQRPVSRSHHAEQSIWQLAPRERADALGL